MPTISEKGTHMSGDSKIDIKIFRLAAVFSFIFVFFTAVTNTSLHGAALWSYAAPLLFFVAGCSFYNGDYFRKKRYSIFMLYGLWFVICRWLSGDAFMMSINQLSVPMLAAVLLLALPFACVMEDSRTRRYLDIFCWVTVLGYAVLFAFVYIGHFRGEQIILVKDYLEFGSEIKEGSLFIKMCNSDDYPTDYLAACNFLLALYLTASSWPRRKLLSAFSLLLSGFFSVTVVLIPCRTVLVGICGGLLLIFLVFLQRLKISKKMVWSIFFIFCVAGAAIVLLGSDHLYTAVANNSRSALARLKTLSGRSWAWEAGLRILIDEPDALLYGFSMDDVMQKILRYDDQGLGHMHNGFMEALMLTGVPGFLAVTAFSIKLVVSSVRVFFARTAEITAAHKMMVVAVAVIFFMNFFDSLLFINRTNTDVLSFFFALFAGYIFETEDTLKAIKHS